ncbi:uncharacterized protein [Panulirus ornatus]|uniref:uncharacterized protein n=1 Tax=Panulirus ornatus TaxID=150431 RepID=UPI003A8C04A1
MDNGKPCTAPVLGSGSERPIIIARNVKFVNIHETGSTPLASLNPFLIRKVTNGWSGPVDMVRKLASGDLVKVRWANQVADLLKLTQFHIHKVVVTIPVSTNSCWGIIYCPELMDMSEDEIVKELADVDVVAARYITKFVNGTRRWTPLINLTFGQSKLPDEIFVGYLRCQAKPYIPNSLRCFKCQHYGHPEKSCSFSAKCGKCATDGHTADSCTNDRMLCVNCNGNHPSWDRECPRFRFEKEVCEMKTRNNISYGEARKRVKESCETPKRNESYASGKIICY